jgi:hypothetical protein
MQLPEGKKKSLWLCLQSKISEEYLYLLIDLVTVRIY